MLWQPYFSDHRDLLSYVTIDWETVWGWHAQIEKCNQVSSWPMSVEVVSPCSLTDAVCESSLCWSLCFSSVLVNTAVVVRSIVWNTFVARASWSLFFLISMLASSLFALSFMSWSVWNLAVQTSLRCSAVWQASWTGESVILLHSSRVRESSRVILHPHAWSLYFIIIYIIYICYYLFLKENWDAISVASSRRLCQRTDTLRFACWGCPTWSCQVDFQHHTAVCGGLPNSHRHHLAAVSSSLLDSSLENTCLVWSLFRASFLVPADTDSESRYGFLGTLGASKPKQECCLTFSRFLEIRQVDLGFATTSSSPVFPFLNSLRHGLRLFNWTKMAARWHGKKTWVSTDEEDCTIHHA